MSNKIILVVDDEQDLRSYLKEVFITSGYKVLEAEDGLSAWEHICKTTISFIVTDFNMPRMNGLDLLRRISEHRLNIPTILWSSDCTLNRESVILAGALQCLDKNHNTVLSIVGMIQKHFSSS